MVFHVTAFTCLMYAVDAYLLLVTRITLIFCIPHATVVYAESNGCADVMPCYVIHTPYMFVYCRVQWCICVAFWKLL